MIPRLLALLLLALPLAAIEPDSAGYERILIPVLAPDARPGAFNSMWRTELSVRNESDLPAQVFQAECSFFCTCVWITCGTHEVAPRSPVIGLPDRYPTPAENVGAFIYVNRARADELAIQLRLRDVSRPDQSWGTEIPVVRDRDMRLGPTYLLDVPLNDGFRQHLRVYGASSPSGTGVVRVRIFPENGNTLLAERVLTLLQGRIEVAPNARRPPIPSDDEFPQVPANAELASLRDVVPAGTTGPVRLEITSLTPGLKYWAMISVTNNTTQQVTLITPQ